MKIASSIFLMFLLLSACQEEVKNRPIEKPIETKETVSNQNMGEILKEYDDDKTSEYMLLYAKTGDTQYLDSVKVDYQLKIDQGMKEPEIYLYRALIEEKINGYQSAKPYYKKTRDLVNWRLKHKDQVATKYMKDLSRSLRNSKKYIRLTEKNIISGSKFYLAICEIMDGDEKKGIEQYKQLGKDNLMDLSLGLFEINKREDVLNTLFPDITETEF
ncbi:MAG: hypothetical protein ACK46Y_17390 [Fluviicola sp.]